MAHRLSERLSGHFQTGLSIRLNIDTIVGHPRITKGTSYFELYSWLVSGEYLVIKSKPENIKTKYI
jgi:hypothetical protein